MKGGRNHGGRTALSTLARIGRVWALALTGLTACVPVAMAHTQRAAALESPDAAPAVAAGSSIAPATVPTGPRTVAVVMLNFVAHPEAPWTADEARAAVFTGAESLNAFQREQSSGAISLTGRVRPDGDVFGWYTIDAPVTSCDPDGWMAAANADATAAGVDLTGYQHRIYVFPRVAACPWSGTADMPGRDSFLNGTIGVRMLAHEFGHNLGWSHAGTLRCVDPAGAPVSFSATCTAGEYGDPYDIMGTSARHASAFRKVTAGFIPASAIRTATQTGTYRIASSSVASSGVVSLRVGRGTGAGYWYMELRSPAGAFENVAATDPSVTGVTVRAAGEYTASATRLIDTTPATPTMTDAPLHPGHRFVDPVSGVEIAVQSAVLGVATLHVTVPGTVSLDEPLPAASPSAVSTVTARATLRRVSARRGALRVVVPVAVGARRCTITVSGRAMPCHVRAGQVSLVTNVPVGQRTLPVHVRVDGVPLLAVHLRVPSSGRSTHVTKELTLR